MKTHYCNGIKTSGYWKGYNCAAIGKYKVKGKWYCANHLPQALVKHKIVHQIGGINDQTPEA